MKNDAIINIPVVPEEFGTDCFKNIDLETSLESYPMLSEMTTIERKFVNGLIRYYQPKSVLEIGVSGGGGSAVLLDAISDIKESSLTSIDIMDSWYVDNNKQVGFIVGEFFPGLVKNNWELITGKDPVEILPKLDKKYDFVVIDTAHIHPVESLNFLSALPFLNDGAVVVLHDISLCIIRDFYHSLAPRILWSSAVGDKISPKNEYYYPENSDNKVKMKNIGAFQISNDTKKYIRNIFESLLIPWERYIDTIDAIGGFIQDYYDVELVNIFNKSKEFNKTLHSGKTKLFSEAWIQNMQNRIKKIWLNKPLVFYGAGRNMVELVKIFEKYDVPFNFPIWDINAEKIVELRGHKVINPDFVKTAPYGHIAVITIHNKIDQSMIREKLENIGFIVLTLNNFAGLE